MYECMYVLCEYNYTNYCFFCSSSLPGNAFGASVAFIFEDVVVGGVFARGE